MPIPAICPYCKKTVSIEQAEKTVCPDCGQTIELKQLKAKGLLVDAAREVAEFNTAKKYFVNTDFLSAKQHFEKALAANKNSYLSQYFVRLCDIYLSEATPKFDVMRSAVDAIKSSLELLACSNVGVGDRLSFIVAMLNEIKIIILNRLKGGDELYETNIALYRKQKIADLTTLLELFKIDGEELMSFSPDVVAVLSELSDYAIALCHKTVQTVVVGDELLPPTNTEYKSLLSLCNDYSFFATSFDGNYDVRKYTPDFSQNETLDEKVSGLFDKFDAKNKPYAKKLLTGNIEEYDEILSECKKAIELTYLNCFKSMCDEAYNKRGKHLVTGVSYLFRILTPRVTLGDKKRPQIHIDKFVDLYDNILMFNKFLTEADKFDRNVKNSLKQFFAKLFEIMDMYFIPIYEKNTKNLDKIKEARGELYAYYEKLLFSVACSCSVALKEYVSFDCGKDKNRAKLVKLCKTATDEFLLLRNYNLAELEQSNIYRPILDISNSVLKEVDE